MGPGWSPGGEHSTCRNSEGRWHPRKWDFEGHDFLKWLWPVNLISRSERKITSYHVGRSSWEPRDWLARGCGRPGRGVPGVPQLCRCVCGGGSMEPHIYQYEGVCLYLPCDSVKLRGPLTVCLLSSCWRDSQSAFLFLPSRWFHINING